MAVVVTRPAPTTSAVLIASVADSGGSGDDWGGKSFLLKNVTATAAVFLGPSGVTTANGFQWDTADGPITWTLEPGESLYGIVASVTQTIHVASTGR